MIKKISLIIFYILLITNVNALENNSIDLSKKGSITITLKEKEENTTINGAEITIYHIANSSIKDNNLIFTKKEELSCEINFNNFENKELITNVSKCINENIIKYVGITTNGKVKFTNLEQGIYLVSQTNNVEGYSNIESFLVAIPKVENNIWNYDINAIPKTNIYKVIDLVVEKKWNTISKNIPKYVTFELYKEDVLIDTKILNEDNNWTYTFLNIEKSDKYSVKEINIPKEYTPSYKVTDNIFTITNSDVLANTGQIFYPIIITFFIGVIFIIFGIKTIKR